MYGSHLQNISNNGFTVVDNIFGSDEIRSILQEISKADANKLYYR
jgi:hypothetical protein